MKYLLAVCAFFLLPAWSDAPADCPVAYNGPGDAAPLEVTTRLPPRPGMPRGASAYIALQLPTTGTVCVPQDPQLSTDVLHGDKSTDPLSGRKLNESVNPQR